MKTWNYYDFEAMEVNPQHNRRTEYGFNSTRYTSPKKGDKKNWKKFFLHFMATNQYVADKIRPLMGFYGVTEKDIQREKDSTKNRVIVHRTEAKRLNEVHSTAKKPALHELMKIKHLPNSIKYYEERIALGDKKYKKKLEKDKKLLARLSNPRKNKRRLEVINRLRFTTQHENIQEKWIRQENLL